MTAIIKIVDDNGNPKGVYELKPSRIYERELCTEYVFEFQYAVAKGLNDITIAESEGNNG